MVEPRGHHDRLNASAASEAAGVAFYGGSCFPENGEEFQALDGYASWRSAGRACPKALTTEWSPVRVSDGKIVRHFEYLDAKAVEAAFSQDQIR